MPHSLLGKGEFMIQVTHEAKVIDRLNFLVPDLRTQTWQRRGQMSCWCRFDQKPKDLCYGSKLNRLPQKGQDPFLFWCQLPQLRNKMIAVLIL